MALSIPFLRRQFREETHSQVHQKTVLEIFITLSLRLEKNPNAHESRQRRVHGYSEPYKIVHGILLRSENELKLTQQNCS